MGTFDNPVNLTVGLRCSLLLISLKNEVRVESGALDKIRSCTSSALGLSNLACRNRNSAAYVNQASAVSLPLFSGLSPLSSSMVASWVSSP